MELSRKFTSICSQGLCASALLASALIGTAVAQESCEPISGTVAGRADVCQCPKCRAKRSEDACRWSDEWYAAHGNGPVGSSQKYHAGKVWPPYPRPQENGEFSTQFHAAHYWPHPYNCWDRGYVKAITGAQIANGWAHATTIYAYHFDADTQLLNDNGRMYLRWILAQAPPQYRVVYVQVSADEAETSTRMGSVQAAVAASGASQVPVTLRNAITVGRPALEVDAIRRSEIDTQHPARLPFASAAGNASGGGAPPAN